MKKEYIRLCPKCGSNNIKNILLISPAEMPRPVAKPLYISLPYTENYVCLDCDYGGVCPEVETTQVSAFKKSLKKK